MAVANKFRHQYIGLFIVGILFFILVKPVIAQTPETIEPGNIRTLWMLIAGILVFFMNAGFAMLEAGLCQSRNAISVLAKNLIVFCVSIIAFWLVGFGLMFGDGNSWIGLSGWFFKAFEPPLQDINFGFDSLNLLYPNQPRLLGFFFQLVFAGTTATIVSGAMAERVKFWAFFWFVFLLIAIAYPITGRWIWHPDGWLGNNLNFLDFAGSTVVHSVGGMAGLVGAMLIGPRRGWQGYNPDRTRGNRFAASAKSFNHYSLSLATLGCLILWVGWFGFNGGSAIAIADIPHIIITTMLSGASGGIFVLLLRGLRSKKPALPLVINGILGGLVSITASSIYVSLAAAILIGAIGSLWIILIEKLLEVFRIDDPVGAIPVHLGCGIWGTLAAGMFANQLTNYIDRPIIRIEQISSQIAGIVTVNFTIACLSLSFWLIIGLALYAIESANQQLKGQHKTNSKVDSGYSGWYKYLHFARTGIRVSQQEESQGSDGTFS